MKLYEAIKEIFDQVGYDCILTPRFTNMLGDFLAYKEVPASKYVLLHLVERYGKTLYEQYESGKYSPILIKKYQQDIVDNFGFNPDIVEYVLASLSYGFGWTSQVPQYGVSGKPKHSNEMGSTLKTVIKSNETFSVNGVSFAMVFIEGGTFMMGATPEQDEYADDSEKPVHQVTLDSYMIGQTEVTQELWQAVMGSNPSCYHGNNLPVERVSWDDCQNFIQRLNQQTDRKFRLPTEAEWEFAARGGNKSKGYVYAGSNDLNEVGWYLDNEGDSTHRVCTKAPNELGIYDMSGNVDEWCQDWYGDYSVVPCRNPQGPSEGSYRVNRGGDYRGFASYCRVSNRDYYDPEDQVDYLGLRLAL